MNQEEIIKRIVKEKYGEIASGEKAEKSCSCCCDGVTRSHTYTMLSDNYEGMKGYVNEADMHLGCGTPTLHIQIRKGDTVLDLGSGAGNDCFVAHSLTGEAGRVIGLDFTDEMIEKARENNDKFGFKNIEFIKGDIENIPLTDNEIDVVISNCVLNLVPDKSKAFREIFRVLKKGGHFSISDVVIKGDLPASLRSDAVMYAGCISGALEKQDYLEMVAKSGFRNIEIKNEKRIVLPVEVLGLYMDRDQIHEFREGESGIYSITLTAEKPG